MVNITKVTIQSMCDSMDIMEAAAIEILDMIAERRQCLDEIMQDLSLVQLAQVPNGMATQ